MRSGEGRCDRWLPKWQPVAVTVAQLCCHGRGHDYWHIFGCKLVSSETVSPYQFRAKICGAREKVPILFVCLLVDIIQIMRISGARYGKS
jgi:hypothetical protein